MPDDWKRNLAAIWIAQTVTMVAFSFILPFVPLYLQSMGIGSATEAAQWAGLIGGAGAISMAVAQPIWGNLADRWGRKPMVVRSMLGGSVMVILMGLAQTPEQFLVLRLIQGAITGVVAAGNALVATSTPKHRLGFALGLMQVAIFVGSSIGPLVGGLIADTFGFRASFYSAGVLLLAGGAIVVFFVQERFTRPDPAAARPGVIAESRALLAIAVLPVLIGVIFLIQLGGVIVSPILSLFIAALSGADNAATVAGLVLAATGAVSAASAVTIGRFSDRVGPVRILPVCLVGAALSYFPQAFVHQVWELLLLRMLLGVFLGGLMPSANALVATAVPAERRGAAYGLAATAMSLANAVGPISGAGIATWWGMRAVFLATGALFAVAWAWVSIGLRKRVVPRPQAEPAALSALAYHDRDETRP